MNNPGVGGVKLRPVIRTYSAPLPLTNPQLLQPPPFHPHGNISGGGGGMANMQISSDPYPTPPSDQEMYNIKQHIRNNVLQKSKVSISLDLSVFKRNNLSLLFMHVPTNCTLYRVNGKI